MKMFLYAVCVLGFLGLLFGMAIANVGSKPFARPGQETEAAKVLAAVREHSSSELQADAAQVPIAYCESTHFEFDRMNPLTISSHEFRIENRGKAPLVLASGGSTCKCTLSDLETAVVAPGEHYPVRLTWNSGHARRDFQQSATIHTNDRENPEIQLTVSGEVRAVCASTPGYLDFDRLAPDAPTTRDMLVFSQIWNEMTIERIESTSPHFSAQAIEVTEANVGFGIASEVSHATCVTGMRVTYDGKAPVGPLSARLRVYVRPPSQWNLSQHSERGNSPTDAEEAGAQEAEDNRASLPEIQYPLEQDGTVLLEFEIMGDVLRRLSLYGPSVDRDGLVDLGSISEKTSPTQQWNIVGRLRGENAAATVDVELTGIPGLNVTVEMHSNQKAKSSFRLTLHIDRPLKPAVYSHQTAGQLRIVVQSQEDEEILELPVHLRVL